MADKNVRLKSGNDVLYPQTKVGNILNDDGSKFERYINIGKYLVNNTHISQEGFDYLLKLKDNKNFIGINYLGYNYDFVKYNEQYNSDNTLNNQYLLFMGKSSYGLKYPINKKLVIDKKELYIKTVSHLSMDYRTSWINYTQPDGTASGYAYLSDIGTYNNSEMDSCTYHPVLYAYASQASNGYIKKINIRSNEYKIPDTVYFDITSNSDNENPNTLTSDGLSNLNDLFTNNRLIGIIYENKHYKLSKNDISNNNYIFVCVDCDNNNYSLKTFTINSTTGTYSSNQGSVLSLTTDNTPTSQLIPSITTNNEQQNLTVGEGLAIADGQLKSTLSNFKYGCIKLNNIKIGENKYSLHIYLLDYLYDAIINGASSMFDTTLTRDTFPNFIKTNITSELFIQLITKIIEMNQSVCAIPYLSFDIQQTLPTESYMYNCSLIKEGTIGFVCGTNNIVFDNPTFEDDFSLVYNNSFYGD